MGRYFKWRRFTQYPNLKNVLFATGGTPEEIQRGLYAASHKQWALRPLKKRMLGFIYNLGEMLGPGQGKVELRKFYNRTAGAAHGVAGTVSRGKVRRVYLDPNQPPGFLREALVHEKFHLKPIVGQSEILAHIAGGLGRKGGVGHKLLRGAASYGHLWRTRPLRALGEHGLIVGAPLGIAKAISGKKGKDD